jgi:hypothetical protein
MKVVLVSRPAIGPMVATLLHGMAMALYKTLVGSVPSVV